MALSNYEAKQGLSRPHEDHVERCNVNPLGYLETKHARGIEIRFCNGINSIVPNETNLPRTSGNVIKAGKTKIGIWIINHTFFIHVI